EDIAACKRSLALGQVLLVSVVATVEPDTSERRMIREFGELAARVRAAGADAVEANLSCPNVARREGEVYRHPELAGSIAASVKAAADGAPVTVKIGHIADEALLERLLCALDGHADGVTLINGVSREIRDASGAPAFGP